ncbi:hypothetical protein SLS60_005565 [Paraconiothyrium brasiliense]|uniref:Uncharacterized protein n=1 Tax=Paraconiothyrium brasiliense TaxID=300254 RepID=A0ABR3RIE7_9PLEO
MPVSVALVRCHQHVHLAFAAPAYKLGAIVMEPTLGNENPLLAGGLYRPAFQAHLIPSASLVEPYKFAKDAAVRSQKTTFLRVQLIDVVQSYCRQVESFVMALQRLGIELEDHMSFSHLFLIGVGPEGVVMFQSYKAWGPVLDEYIVGGGLRVRNWQESDDFISTFDSFARKDKKTFTSSKNQLFKKMFGLDLLDLTTNPDTHIQDDVKMGDVLKFHWRIEKKMRKDSRPQD